MSYIVIARKYRPKNFDEIIGQEHITRTLKNAIRNERIAHAYLFSGPRGIGKTTTARVLSKSLNCEKGPIDTPCNSCSNCIEIDESRNIDVLEIDGASNRGIDEIRTLQENIRYAPTQGKHKIYIIDEVHMLTPEAFNALLKTLEEPPSHVIFIFATTQPHKLPSTVLSRCQRFNFRRLTVSEIDAKLKDIAEKENIKIEEDARILIARQADGSLRDGESMLDQLFTYTDTKISINEVRKMFGFLEEDIYFTLTDSIKKKDENKILNIIDDAFDKGYNMEEFVIGYIKHLRKIFLLKNEVEIQDLSKSERTKYEQVVGYFSNFLLLQFLNRISLLIRKMKNTAISRILLEIEFLTLSRFEDSVHIQELLKSIENMDPEKSTNKTKENFENYNTTSDQNTENKENHNFENVWDDLVNKICSLNPPFAGILQNLKPSGYENDVVTIKLQEPYGYIENELKQKNGKKLIEENLTSMMGKPIKIKFLKDNKKSSPKEKKESKLKEHKMVKKAQKILNAEIVDKKQFNS
jgi:DNA polymerase-3 subunit gamma/tau